MMKNCASKSHRWITVTKIMAVHWACQRQNAGGIPSVLPKGPTKTLHKCLKPLPAINEFVR